MNRIREYRAARGWSLQQLAEATGTSKSQIDKLEKGARRLTVEWMVRLSRPLGISPRDLLPEAAAIKPKPLPYRAKTKAAAHLIPVIGAGGKSIDHVPRPYFLAHAKDAYALYMPDDSMAPRYRVRQLLFINPYKPAAAGDGVVIFGKKGGMQVREFVQATAKGLTLREYRPKQRETTLPPHESITVHTVAGSIEL